MQILPVPAPSFHIPDEEKRRFDNAQRATL
jgi:hypothetical protein